MAESKPNPKMPDNSVVLHDDQEETHGLRDDIDKDTPVSEVKAPGVLQRAKEEIEALVEAIHPKKESSETKGV